MTDADTPDDHITITSDPYRGVERDGDVVRIRREGVSIPVDVGDLPALIAALEAFEVDALDGDVNRPTAETTEFVYDPDAGGFDKAGDVPEFVGADDAPEHACPECGEETHDNLGGRACGECGWSE